MKRKRWLQASFEWTTEHLGVLAPVTTGSMVNHGTAIGADLLGGEFTFDPFTAYAQGFVTNPNLVVLGQLGKGKSAFIKTFLLRELKRGRRAVVLDPKGEYESLAAVVGVTPIRLEPGGSIQLNPVRGGPDPTSIRTDVALLVALLEHGLKRGLTPGERAALVEARGAVSLMSNATIGAIGDALFEPQASAAKRLHCSVSALQIDGRELALELLRLTEGDLAGMFDAVTSPSCTLDHSLVILDLSAVWNTSALPLVIACTLAWLEGASSTPLSPRYLVLDEAWAVLSDLSVSRWLQGSWKLARSTATSNILVLHRVSDVLGVGDRGDSTVALAAGLLADSGTSVCFQLGQEDATDAGEILGHGATEIGLLPTLGRGVALWRVSGEAHLVRHHVHDHEREMIDSDHAMRR